ncbi:MAG: phospholipid carrier-dependent glycosyltransferase [Geobacter sp.]|nr:phospholipid carrier-dependent glycosyltransferase [Geobacter sp.]
MRSPANRMNSEKSSPSGPAEATVLPAAERHFVAGLFLLTVAGFILRVFLLQAQPVSVDDFGVALTAINYTESGQLGPTMWNHPNLCGILVYGALKLFGTGVVGLKGVSILFGTLTIPLVGLVARRIMDERAALLATLLWVVEPLAIDFSRQAIGDIYLAFFPLLGIYAALRHRETGRAAWLFAAGASFGCGLSTKWSVLFPLLVTFVLIVQAIRQERGEGQWDRPVAIAHACALLILLPLTIYLLTFIPWFGRGYDAGEWPALQRAMYGETAHHTGYRPLAEDKRDHWAYEWFARPAVTYEDIYINLPAEGPAGVNDNLEGHLTILLAIANPLVWLLVLPAAFFTAWQGIRKRQGMLCYLAGLFFCAYLPLALTRRPIWANTALSVLPFAFMAVAYFVSSLARKPAVRRRIMAVYAAAVVAATAPLYPLVIGKGGEVPFLKEYLQQNYVGKAFQLRNSGATPQPGK